MKIKLIIISISLLLGITLFISIGKKSTKEIIAGTSRTEEQTGENKNMNTNELEVIPTMQSRSEAKNYAWAGNFQIVWNDFMQELLKGPVKFDGNQLEMAEQLNKKNFSEEDLSQDAYYKKWGEISPSLRAEIEESIKNKFNETGNLLNKIDWSPSQEKNIKKYLFYSMLKKNFTFTEQLDNLGKGSFKGIENPVEYFGINGSDKRAGNVVYTVFYNNENDHAIFLQSKQGDIVYLFRTDEDGTLSELYKKMFDKRNEEINKIHAKAKEPGEFIDVDINATLWENDELKAPLLSFDITQNFDELCNKKILSEDKDKYYLINKALQNVQFKMNEAGVKLKSEAAMEVSEEMGILDDIDIEPIKPRYFHYTGRYAVFVSEDIVKKPYFAMLINDPSALQPVNAAPKEEKTDPKAFPDSGILYWGDDIALKKWIDAGGNVNMKDEYGNTPLHYTTGHAGDYNPTILTEEESIPNPKIVKLLLKSGANVNAKNNVGRTPLYNSFGWGVTDLLLENHAEVNIKDNDGDTPLHIASYLRDPINVKKILDRKANINAKNNHGNTPLHLIPLTSFFDTKADLTNREYEFKNDSAIVKLLLENGADADIKNNEGKTPLDIAKDRNYMELIQLLKAAGAKE